MTGWGGGRRWPERLRPVSGMRRQGLAVYRRIEDRANDSKTVTFMHPFSLSETDEVHPAGAYTVETDEELLQASSTPAYRRVATLLRLERTTGTVQTGWSSR
jgi:hypothetical protein